MNVSDLGYLYKIHRNAYYDEDNEILGSVVLREKPECMVFLSEDFDYSSFLTSNTPQLNFDLSLGFFESIFRTWGYEKLAKRAGSQLAINQAAAANQFVRVREAFKMMLEISATKNGIAVLQAATSHNPPLTVEAYVQLSTDVAIRKLESDLRIKENRDRIFVQQEIDHREALHKIELAKIDAQARIFAGNLILTQLHQYQHITLEHLIEADGKIRNAEFGSAEHTRWLQHREILQKEYTLRNKKLEEKIGDYRKVI